ncbi:MAG: hypothetical protein WAT79_15840 [Saprospiraceae bacterium]
MQRVSSNFTIFFKLFLPTFWGVFFGMFALFVVFYNNSELVIFQNTTVKITICLTYFAFFTLLYFTIFQLKRVEFGLKEYHVSDYFTTYRLIYEDIESVKEINILGWLLIVIKLKGKGSFGKRFFFLANKFLYHSFLDENPALASYFKKEVD